MTELQAAIEAAGLPEPKIDFQQKACRWWRGCIEIELRKGDPGYDVTVLQNIVIADIELARITYIPTAAEACARVKQWLEL